MMDEAVFYLGLLAGAVIVLAFIAYPLKTNAVDTARLKTAYSVALILNETCRNGSITTIYTTGPVSVADGRVDGVFPVRSSGSVGQATCIAQVSGEVVACGEWRRP